MYRALSQDTPRRSTVVLDVSGDPDQYQRALEAAADTVDGDIPLYNIKSLSRSVEETMAGFSLIRDAFVVLGILAAVFRPAVSAVS